ncbi:hypothetical protein [uncultured Cellulomonas sp.]|uniref:hypothetical protein n=1 Tax=uncultured Cellulomonas sp. TaxID=189682 RepID=UPI002637D0E6|nr:hypothetical protein [uncultured Cellulomonas sp.]
MTQDGTASSNGAATTTKATPLEAFIAALGALPESESKPASGSVAADGDAHGRLEDLIALSLLDEVVGPVVDRVADLRPGSVLVVEDRAYLHSCWGYTGAEAQIAALETTLTTARSVLTAEDEAAARDAAPPSPGGRAGAEGGDVVGGAASMRMLGVTTAGLAAAAGALLPAATAAVSLVGAAPALMGAVSDVVGMFRTSYSFTGRVMTAQGTPLVAEVARTLRARQVPVRVDGFGMDPDSPLLERLAACRTQAVQLSADAVALRGRVATLGAAVARAQAELDRLLTADRELAAEGKEQDELRTRIDDARAALALGGATHGRPAAALSVVEAALTATDTVVTQLTTSADGAMPPLVAALLREKAVTGGVSHVLFVSIDHAGSSAGTPSGRSTEVVWTGGLQVSFLALELSSGEVVAAGVEQAVGSAKFQPSTGTLAFSPAQMFRRRLSSSR